MPFLEGASEKIYQLPQNCLIMLGYFQKPSLYIKFHFIKTQFNDFLLHFFWIFFVSKASLLLSFRGHYLILSTIYLLFAHISFNIYFLHIFNYHKYTLNMS